MTSQAADGPETVAASRRSKITPEREREFFDAVLEQIRECGYDAVTMEGDRRQHPLQQVHPLPAVEDQAPVRRGRPARPPQGDASAASTPGRSRTTCARPRGPRAAGRLNDTKLLQALGHAVTQDAELAQALREALVDPEIAALREILRRGVERGEIAADHPALEYIPAQMFGVVRARPVVDGQYADPEYLVRFVEAAVLPALGLT